jgi:hypothetical protein
VLGCIEADFCNEYSGWNRALSDLHPSAPFESNLKTTTSASGKRHPGEKQCTDEETIRSQRLSEAWGKEMKEVQRVLCSDSASENRTESKYEILRCGAHCPGCASENILLDLSNRRISANVQC